MYLVLITSKDNNNIKTWKMFGSLEAAEQYKKQLDTSKLIVSVCKGWW